MMAVHDARTRPVLVAAALLLVVAAVGLPVNHLSDYGLLLAAAVIICCGGLTARPSRWLLAVAIVAALIAARPLLAPPRIEEGHNIFLVDRDLPAGALQAGLPAPVFKYMLAQFDSEYPVERRCEVKTPGCWRDGAFPDRVFAFSADGLWEHFREKWIAAFPLTMRQAQETGATSVSGESDVASDHSALSRRVRGIDFSDANWLGLGFGNDVRYNWHSDASDVARAKRDRRVWKVFGRWQFSMPWFMMVRIPPAFAGSQLCWRGDVLWEGADQQFEPLSHDQMACRTLAPSDAGRRIFAIAIRSSEPLAMRLEANSTITAWRLAEDAAKILAIIAVIALLVEALAWRALVLPAALLGLALVVIVLNDVTFVGGLRPQDGGDDGLQYDSYGRTILQDLAAGNIVQALEGSDPVFLAVPGIRYFRAIEHAVFGETNLGYLSVILALPFAVLALFRRFLPARWAIASALIFVAVPVGLLVGSSYVQYVKWAARGFADPLAAFAFLCALVLLIPRPEQPDRRFGSAFAAALMFAIAVFVRPNLAPGVGILLAGAGLLALWSGAWWRVTGLCLGFAFVLVMPVHNYVFGGILLPFSTNATLPQTLVMPPAAWAAAFSELLHLDLAGQHVGMAIHQIVSWLAGPGEFLLLAPVNAALIAILLGIAIAGRGFDFWLRLIAGATLSLHAVALFYTMIPRYHLLTWLLTSLVALVWLRERGLSLWHKRYPAGSMALRQHRLTRTLSGVLARLEAASTPAPRSA